MDTWIAYYKVMIKDIVDEFPPSQQNMTYTNRRQTEINVPMIVIYST